MGEAPKNCVVSRGAQRTKLWVRMPSKPCLQVREEQHCFESRDGQFTASPGWEVGHPVLCKAWWLVVVRALLLSVNGNKRVFLFQTRIIWRCRCYLTLLISELLSLWMIFHLNSSQIWRSSWYFLHITTRSQWGFSFAIGKMLPFPTILFASAVLKVYISKITDSQ